MQKTTGNKRLRLSIELLKRALIQLLQVKDISKITIKELCETAGINRSTFYTYYDTQYELLEDIEREILEELVVHFKDLRPETGQREVTESVSTLLRYTEKNIDSFRALLGEHGDPSFHHKIITANQAVIREWNVSGSADATAERTAYLFATCGGVEVIKEWIMDEERMPRATLAGLLGNLICNGYLGVFK